MLHILWMIIKFILILIGIILGLLLLVLLLLLFCPVRYQAEGMKEAGSFRTATGRARISWLFGGVSFSLGFTEGQTDVDFRLFGIPLMKLFKKIKNRKKKQTSDADKKETLDDSGAWKDEGEPSDTYTESIQAASPENEEEILSDQDVEKERRWHETAEKLKKLFYNLGNKTRKLWDKIKAVYRRIMKIPEDMEKLSRKKDALCDKIDWWSAFIGHPRTQEAVSLVRTKVFRLLRHVFPTRIEGELAFDCTDPSVTGSILAILGMTIPLHRNCIRVTPLFENRNVLYGYARFRGRVYGVMLVKTALELYFDKNIKYVIRRWKHK